jgi:hypothetical protein
VAKATALKAGANVVADLDLGHPINLLRGQAAVTDELAALPQRQQPQPEAALTVEPLVPLDPGQRLAATLRARVVAHHLGIAEQRGHVVEVVRRHLAKRESRRRRRRGHTAIVA